MQEIDDSGVEPLAVAFLPGLRPVYVEEDEAVKSFNPDVEEAKVLITARLRNIKAYIEILRDPNDDTEIVNVETDDASVVRCEETADMAVPEGKHGS
ncbi:hypothetical protein THAOC_10730, partial [Thalassiosira oceanica]